MSNEKVNSAENKELGISLDKKTIIAIISALVIIMAFVGVLTQVLPRGEYDVIVENGYEQIVDGTYKELEDYKMPPLKQEEYFQSRTFPLYNKGSPSLHPTKIS